jgi:hypothetical protein
MVAMVAIPATSPAVRRPRPREFRSWKAAPEAVGVTAAQEATPRRRDRLRAATIAEIK